MIAKKIATYINANNLCPREVSTQLPKETTLLRVIGLYSKNRKEWTLIDAAAAYGNITTVPLYDTLGKEYTAHIVE